MEQIIAYLMDRYDPESVILYGSYADGSNNPDSDFDALVIMPRKEHGKDTSVIHGVQLDVFLFSPEDELRASDFPQLYHCRIVRDKYGKAAQLCGEVKAYIDGAQMRTGEEIEANLVWCEKMLRRTAREDAEGYFRWHWLLCDSLEFYCNIRKRYYFGPKKTLKQMMQEDSEAFEIYRRALSSLERDALACWITYLKEQFEKTGETV